MKAVILAGGLGSRLSEETTVKPKPMVEIGGKPILWHIMKIYAAHGIDDFVVCLGYKGYVIKEWFANYALHTSDVTFDMRSGEMEVHHSTTEPWRVTLVETGDETMTGGRLKRVLPYVGDETFCLTYGDGVADVDVRALIAHHREQGRLATVTAVQPPGPLRRAGDRRRRGARASPRSRAATAPGSTAASSSASPASATRSPATTRSGRRSRCATSPRAAQLTRLSPPRLLAGDGHAARAQRARGAVGVRRRAVAVVGP